RAALANCLECGRGTDLRHDRQQEQSMSDRATKRPGSGTLHVNVDPLMIARKVREAVDQALGNLQLRTPWTEFRRNQAAQRLEIIETDFTHDPCLWCRRSNIIPESN